MTKPAPKPEREEHVCLGCGIAYTTDMSQLCGKCRHAHDGGSTPTQRWTRTERDLAKHRNRAMREEDE